MRFLCSGKPDVVVFSLGAVGGAVDERSWISPMKAPGIDGAMLEGMDEEEPVSSSSSDRSSVNL